MSELLIAALVIEGGVSVLFGVLVGWYLTNEEWKAAWDRRAKDE